MSFPTELLLDLSKYLNIKSLINFRLVCRSWRCFIDEFCLKELILFINVYPTLELWKCNSEPVDFKNVIFLKSDNCFSDNGFKYMFRNIKKFYLSIKTQKEIIYKLGIYLFK
jgi:hypothetical protein